MENYKENKQGSLTLNIEIKLISSDLGGYGRALKGENGVHITFPAAPMLPHDEQVIVPTTTARLASAN